MARPKIKIMISSRCNDSFPATGKGKASLTDIRKRLKSEIEAESLFGKEMFEVWINEDEPPEPGSQDSWDLCTEQARSADLMLVLFNGNAGWCLGKGDIGICHAELMTAYAESPGKVSVVSLLDDDQSKRPSGPVNERFQKYVDKAGLFRGAKVTSPDEVVTEAKKAVREALLHIAHHGAREVKQSRHNTGPALDWSRMDFVTRQSAMKDILRDSLLSKEKAQAEGEGVFVTIGNKKTLLVPTAIPAAMTVSAAKEMVGQPFLRDHLHASVLTGPSAGPVHLIACHKNVTESQAMQLLGFPDATIVSGSFGVYVADNVQKIQLCMIANCRDESSTRHGLQKLFDWLGQTGEDDLLAARATSRAKIVKTIAKEISSGATVGGL